MNTMDRLQHFLDVGRTAFPTLAVAEADLQAWLLGHPDADPARAGDAYLACACIHNISGALETFERSLLSRVDDFVARRRMSSEALADLKQSLRERLFVTGRIRDYGGTGALSSWLRVVSLRAAIDLDRKRTELLLGDQSGSDVIARLPGQESPELDFIKETFRSSVERALKGSLGALDSEQRNLLRMHIVDGVTLDQLAALLHVHRATVARRLSAARQAVLDETRRLLCAEVEVGPSEADSLMKLVHSRVEAAFSSFLRVP